MNTLTQQFGGKLPLFHWVGWHGKDGIAGSKTGYDSRDPSIINAQLEVMRQVGGEEFGVVALTYGPIVAPFIHQAVTAMFNQCVAKDIPFMLCFDPWTVKGATDKSQAMVAALMHPEIQMMLNAHNYMIDSAGIRQVMDFATGAVKATVNGAVPKVNLLMNGVDYDWPHIPPVPNKTTLPCAFVQFDDGTGADRNKQVWDQTQPARIVPGLAGGTFWGRSYSQAVKWVQVVTWNDVDEQTSIEAWASMFSNPVRG